MMERTGRGAAALRRAGAAVRLSVATLTVVPTPYARPDRGLAGAAMALAPAVGLLLGGIAAAAGLVAFALGAPPLVAAVLAIGTAVLLTRGLHLDGLADTTDGLGSYRDRETALSIMRAPDIGPFGVAAVVLVLLAQVAALAEMLTRPWYAVVAGVAAATAAGRVGIALACRRGVPAARPEGMGALVSGTVTPLAGYAGWLAVAVVAVPAVPGRPWQGPVAVALGVAASILVTWHAVRRLGGITGDVLGAGCETATTTCYVALSM